MKKSWTRKIYLLIAFFVISMVFSPPSALAAKTVRIGVLLPFTGVIALAGQHAYRALEIVRDFINESGGLWGGTKIEYVKGDAVTPKEAITEATRLINVEKVSLIIGTYSSPRAVPASEVAERNHVIYWEIAAEAEKITKRGLKYLFRPMGTSSTKVIPVVDYIEKVVAPTLKKTPSQIRLATIFEHGDYGTDTSSAFISLASKRGMKVVTAMPHNPATTDLSADIMRLKKSKPDFLFGPTYAQTMMVFWRQVKELGLNIPGGLCGSGTYDIPAVAKTFKSDVDYVLDSIMPFMINPNARTERYNKLHSDFLKRYKQMYKEEPPQVVNACFGHAWILFNDVLPRAGSIEPEAVRKAALAIDIPDGQTTMGYGCKFYPPGHPMAGQNMRVFASLVQYQNQREVTVWPKKLAVKKPWCPMPTWKERVKTD